MRAHLRMPRAKFGPYLFSERGWLLIGVFLAAWAPVVLAAWLIFGGST